MFHKGALYNSRRFIPSIVCQRLTPNFQIWSFSTLAFGCFLLICLINLEKIKSFTICECSEQPSDRRILLVAPPVMWGCRHVTLIFFWAAFFLSVSNFSLKMLQYASDTVRVENESPARSSMCHWLLSLVSHYTESKLDFWLSFSVCPYKFNVDILFWYYVSGNMSFLAHFGLVKHIVNAVQ